MRIYWLFNGFSLLAALYHFTTLLFSSAINLNASFLVSWFAILGFLTIGSVVSYGLRDNKNKSLTTALTAVSIVPIIILGLWLLLTLLSHSAIN